MHSASAYCTCISMYLYCSLYHYQCSATSLDCKVELCRCTLYAKPHMYTYMTYVYRISTMSLCTLHQYQTVSVCYDLTQLHKEYQQSTILSFRSLFCTLSRSCACLLISDLQRPESSTCMHMWAQATVQQVHWVWRQRDLRDMQGVWRWQHTRAQATAQKVLHLWGPCQSHGDSVVMSI